MSRHYTPRRAGARWRAEAPDYVLDCFDNGGPDQHGGTCDRYTVMFTGEMLTGDGTFAGMRIQYLGMSGAPEHPQGFSQWGELDAYQAAQYRYRNHHRRVKWLDLPEEIRRHVRERAEESD